MPTEKIRISSMGVATIIFFSINCFYITVIERKMGLSDTTLITGKFAFIVVALMYSFVFFRLILTQSAVELDEYSYKNFFTNCPTLIQIIDFLIRCIATILIFVGPLLLRNDPFTLFIPISNLFNDFPEMLKWIFILYCSWDLIMIITYYSKIKATLIDEEKKQIKKSLWLWFVLDLVCLAASIAYPRFVMSLYQSSFQDWLVLTVLITALYFSVLIIDCIFNKLYRIITYPIVIRSE